jgi:hypothetical protein
VFPHLKEVCKGLEIPDYKEQYYLVTLDKVYEGIFQNKCRHADLLVWVSSPMPSKATILVQQHMAHLQFGWSAIQVRSVPDVA